MTILLSTDRLTKRFGGLLATDNVSIDVHESEIHALIGPNGAGKSTTFNLITGVLPATGGRVAVLGKSIHRARPQEIDRKSTRLNSSHSGESRMPSSA